MTKNKKQIPDHVHDTADVAQKLDASIFDVWNLAIQNEIGINISKAKDFVEMRFSEQNINEIKALLRNKTQEKKNKEVVRLFIDGLEIMDMNSGELEEKIILNTTIDKKGKQWYTLSDIAKELEGKFTLAEKKTIDDIEDTKPIDGKTEKEQEKEKQQVKRYKQRRIYISGELKDALMESTQNKLDVKHYLATLGIETEATKKKTKTKKQKKIGKIPDEKEKGVSVKLCDLIDVVKRIVRAYNFRRIIELKAEKYFQKNEWRSK